MHFFKAARAILIFSSCGYLIYRATRGIQKVTQQEIGYVYLR